MFYFLSKAIDFLIMPFSIFFILSLGSLSFAKGRRRKQLLVFAFGILYLTSNAFTVNKAFNMWEYKYRNISEITQPYDVGIVLSGGMIGGSPDRSNHPILGVHADRFSEAFLLYKAGKIKKILLTGTSSKTLLKAQQGEIRQAARFLVAWGIPREDIILEEKARNTRENATFSQKILSTRFPGKKYLLITSAFHMNRALGCFAKVNVNVDPYPADFYGGNIQMNFKDLLIPDPDALAGFELLWREWVGFLMYKLAGYC